MKAEIIEINRAEYIDGYKIRLHFSDGTERLINFENFLKGAKNPMTLKYLDLLNFKNFRVKFGDLVWGDFEMCFPILDLHEGKI